jgi:hypothetical protein
LLALQYLSQRADFVAEVGAETWITLTLHTPNEATAFSARALRLSTPPT